MTMNLDSALALHAQALNVRTERATMLSSNIANIDTPGYKARDIDFKAVLQGVKDKVDNGDISRATQSVDMAHHTKYRIPMQASADGNTAELGVEQAQFNSNALDYQTSLTFLNSKIKGIRLAIQGR